MTTQERLTRCRMISRTGNRCPNPAIDQDPNVTHVCARANSFLRKDWGGQTRLAQVLKVSEALISKSKTNWRPHDE